MYADHFGNVNALLVALNAAHVPSLLGGCKVMASCAGQESRLAQEAGVSA